MVCSQPQSSGSDNETAIDRGGMRYSNGEEPQIQEGTEAASHPYIAIQKELQKAAKRMPSSVFLGTRAIRKVTSIYFRQLM
jgi:hypothetical protein